MSSSKAELLKEVELYVKQQFDEKLSKDMLYHNFQHTLEVVEASQEIAKAEGMPEDEQEVLAIAAWFHDLGHIVTYEGHEDESIRIAEEFLTQKGCDDTLIQSVASTITATKMPHDPVTLMQKIMADADLYHIASKNFDERASWLRHEWDVILNQKHTDKEWVEQNIDFLRHHTYHTSYGQNVLQVKKDKIIKKQKKLLKTLKQQEDENLMRELQINEDELKSLKKKLSKVEGRPERGVETMFRLTSKNHIDLSGMADSKANIMISVNAIIISIIVGSLASKLDTNPYLLTPTAILLIVCVTAIVFSILATRPNVTSGIFTKQDIEDKKANLLFFGNFHNMSLPDFEWGMNQLINDSNYLYGSMIRDIYFLGVVLGKKYRLLRISYTIFMFGLVISVIAFIIAISLNNSKPSLTPSPSL